MKQYHTLFLYYSTILLAVFFFSAKTMALSVNFIFVNNSKYTMHITEGKYKCMEEHTKANNMMVRSKRKERFTLFNYNSILYNCNSRQNTENWYMSLYNKKGVVVCSLQLHWNLYYRSYVAVYWHLHYKFGKNADYSMCPYHVNYTTYSQNFMVML